MLTWALLTTSLWLDLDGGAHDFPPRDSSYQLHTQSTEPLIPAALVCQLSALAPCLVQAPTSAYQQLPSATVIEQAMGGRGAMALPLEHTQVAGVIVMAKDKLPGFVQSILSGRSLQLDLHRQEQLTLWHELGHLQIKRLTGAHEYSRWQHETLADLFMLWLSVRIEGNYNLGWQQYHRRNLSLINDISHLSHWSVPVLHRAMTEYSADELAAFAQFEELVAAMALMPGDDSWPEPDLLDEYASLVQRLFGRGAVQALPGYLYWHREKLGRLFGPSLSAMLGAEGAQQLMSQHALGLLRL